MVGEAAPFREAIAAAGVRDIESDADSLRFALDDQAATMPRVVSALVAAGAQVVEVTTEDAPLEDVYFTIVEQADAAGDGTAR